MDNINIYMNIFLYYVDIIFYYMDFENIYNGYLSLLLLLIFYKENMNKIDKF